MKEDLGLVEFVGGLLTFAFMLGIFVGGCVAINTERTRAVEAGVGEWIPGTDGHVRFQFRAREDSDGQH